MANERGTIHIWYTQHARGNVLLGKSREKGQYVVVCVSHLPAYLSRPNPKSEWNRNSHCSLTRPLATGVHPCFSAGICRGHGTSRANRIQPVSRNGPWFAGLAGFSGIFQVPFT